MLTKSYLEMDRYISHNSLNILLLNPESGLLDPNSFSTFMSTWVLALPMFNEQDLMIVISLVKLLKEAVLAKKWLGYSELAAAILHRAKQGALNGVKEDYSEVLN